MFDWIISGADRWAVLRGTGGADDGLRLLVAQRGQAVWITDDGTHGTASIATMDTEDEAVSQFYGALSHFQVDHITEVEAQWTDAEVNAL
jgi:hypothetical protein